MTTQGGQPVCAFHPDRIAYVQCQRCGARVCPPCQTPAAVGVHCPACIRQAQTARPAAKSVLGVSISQSKPWATMTAIGLCLVAYVAQMASSTVTGTSTSQLVIDFGFWAPAAGDKPYLFITAALLHATPMHLLFNMWCLWVVGTNIEMLIGRGRMVVLLLVSAVAGNMAVLAWWQLVTLGGGGQPALTIGASGAVFGLFGALLALRRSLGGDMTGIATIIVLNLVFSLLVAHISWQAHVGGLLAGSALAAVYAYAPPQQRKVAAWAGGLGGGAVLILLWVALAL